MENRSLTAVPGLRVGHATDEAAATGCTVILGPFAAAVHVHGLATGTRELDALSPLHLVPACDALLLTGGSAFGLAAADGVVRWLEARGRGFPTRVARVPIVPAAVLYDLGVGRADVRPDAAMGEAAARAASSGPVAEGRVGAGTGATVGKLLGYEGAEPGGLGSWAERRAGVTVAALVAVNAFGDVLDAEGRIVAGCRDGDGERVDTAALLRADPAAAGIPAAGPAQNTTLAAVATDAPLTRSALQVVARLAAVALARRLSPSGSPFDGDIVFALSTGERGGPDSEERRGAGPAGASGALEPRTGPAELLSLGLRAQAALERAIERAVASRPGEGAEGGG